MYIETSAKLNRNVEQVFLELTKSTREQLLVCVVHPNK